MEYKKHPEINESWLGYCKEMGRYPERADEVQTMFGWSKNSIHFENGGGAFLPKETVRKFVSYCRERGMEVIPEVPSLSTPITCSTRIRSLLNAPTIHSRMFIAHPIRKATACCLKYWTK